MLIVLIIVTTILTVAALDMCEENGSCLGAILVIAVTGLLIWGEIKVMIAVHDYSERNIVTTVTEDIERIYSFNDSGFVYTEDKVYYSNIHGVPQTQQIKFENIIIDETAEFPYIKTVDTDVDYISSWIIMPNEDESNIQINLVLPSDDILHIAYQKANSNE